MNVEYFMLSHLLALLLTVVTHELGHFFMARLLRYRAKFTINILKFQFITHVYKLENAMHQKLIACAGCLFSLLCVLGLRILGMNDNFINILFIYTLIFFLNLHPNFPDGRIFWQ